MIEKKDDLFIELLKTIGYSLKYQFTDIEIKNEAYLPIAHSDKELLENSVLTDLAFILNGRKELPVKVKMISDTTVNKIELAEVN